MKVAIVTYSTKPRGGVVHTLELAGALRRNGVDVELVALGDPETGFFRPTEVPATFVPEPSRKATLTERVFASIDALEVGLRPLAGRFDLVHTQDCIAARAAVRVRNELETGRRPAVVRTVHHVDDFTTPALVDCQRQAILEPDHLIVVSRHWQQLLGAELGVTSEVIHNGLDPGRLALPRGVDVPSMRAGIGASSRFLFFTVGGIEPRKGTQVMVRALALLKETMPEPPMVALVGGHSFQDHRPYRIATLELAHQLGVSLDDDLVQLGTLSDRDLAAWYHASDAFVLPSLKEGWGLVAMEAMSVGLPVIASDIPVFGEYLAHGETALLPTAGDHRQLADAMRAIAEDGTLRRRLSLAGRRTVASFTWNAAATAHARLYERLHTRTSA